MDVGHILPIKKAPPLIKESLDILCYPSKYKKGIYYEFKHVYHSARYVNPKAKSANNENVNTSLGCGFPLEIIYRCVFQNYCHFADWDNIIE